MKKQAVTKTFAEGDLVFAKVRGFPAWPARIMEVCAGQRYQVLFYGTYETGKCKANELWLFNEETKAKFGNQKKKGFVEAMLEIETNPDVALEKSIRVEDLDQTADTSVDQSIVERSADASNLDIDTPSSSAKKPKKRAIKRKAEESPEKAPPTKAAKTSESGKKSRSGRPIKEKKVDDDDSAKHDSPRAAAGQRKMWVCIKATGELIELNLNKNRPILFDSKESEIQWERATAMNAIILKKRTDSGTFIPDEVVQRLEEKTKLSEAEEEILAKAKRGNKITWLKVEQRMVDINIELQKSLSITDPDMNKALHLLEEFKHLSVSKLMFKKQPQIMETIRSIRKYVGPAKEPSSSDAKDTEELSMTEKIQLAADDIFKKIQGLFGVKEVNDFVAFFATAVAEFNMAIQNFPKNKLNHLVSDPTA